MLDRNTGRNSIAILTAFGSHLGLGIVWNKTGTFSPAMLYVDNPDISGDHRACRIGERIGSALKAVPR
jgi:hypothetical protein